MPVNPAPLQRSSALFLRSPTNWGAGRVQGVGVGRGVGLGVGRGVGTGVGAGVGTGVGRCVGAPCGQRRRRGAVGRGDDGDAGDRRPVAWGRRRGRRRPARRTRWIARRRRRRRCGRRRAGLAGVSSAPATPAAGRNGFPTTNAKATAANATIPTAISVRRVARHRLGAVAFGRTTPPATTASDTPQAGHEPFPSAQHLSHATTRQAGHVVNPIRASRAAGPIRFRQCSHAGRGTAFDGGVVVDVLIETIESRRYPGIDGGPSLTGR